MFGTATSSKEIEPLTLETLKNLVERFFPRLYYGTDKNLDSGFVYYCRETDFNPEYIVCHPEDLDRLREIITNRTLVQIKDEPEESRWNRLQKMWGYPREFLPIESVILTESVS